MTEENQEQKRVHNHTHTHTLKGRKTEIEGKNEEHKNGKHHPQYVINK